jgi:transcriptional regulator with XRE-family HTH domain
VIAFADWKQSVTVEGMDAVITDETLKEHLAANVSRLLEQRGMSIRDLASITGEAPITISRICRGLVMPGTGITARIASALQVDVGPLLSEPPPMPPKKMRDSA